MEVRGSPPSGRAIAALRRRLWSEETAIKLIRNQFVRTWVVPDAFEALDDSPLLKKRTLYAVAPNVEVLACLARLPLGRGHDQVASRVDRGLHATKQTEPSRLGLFHYARGRLLDGLSIADSTEAHRLAAECFSQDQHQLTNRHWLARSQLSATMVQRRGEYFWCLAPAEDLATVSIDQIVRECDEIGSHTVAVQAAAVSLLQFAELDQATEHEFSARCADIDRRLATPIGPASAHNAQLGLTSSGFEARLRVIRACELFNDTHDSQQVLQRCNEMTKDLQRDYPHADRLIQHWITIAALATGHETSTTIDLPAIIDDHGLLSHIPRLALFAARSAADSYDVSNHEQTSHHRNAARALWFAIEQLEQQAHEWASAVAYSMHAEFEVKIGTGRTLVANLTAMGRRATGSGSDYLLDEEDQQTRVRLTKLSNQLESLHQAESQSTSRIAELLTELETIAALGIPTDNDTSLRLRNLISQQRLVAEASQTDPTSHVGH